jgi:hypothetical protein
MPASTGATIASSRRARRRPQHERPTPADRREAVELLQHPAGRRALVRRLRRAAHVPAVPQDGRRAEPAAVEQGIAGAGGVRLAEPAGEGRRRAGGALPPRAGHARQAGRHARRGVPQGAEQDPQTRPSCGG